jgi:hypothetical protein
VVNDGLEAFMQWDPQLFKDPERWRPQLLAQDARESLVIGST